MRLRFSVRILLLFTVAIAATFYCVVQGNRRRFAEQKLCTIAKPFDPDVNGYSESMLFGENSDLIPLRGLLVDCELADVEQYLAEAKSIEELELDGIAFDAPRLSRVVAKLPNLRRLELRKCMVTADKTTRLRSETLAYFVIRESTFQGDDKVLFDFPGLVSLDVYGSNVKSFKQFHSCNSIQDIFIVDSPGVILSDADRARLPWLRRYLYNGVSHL
jgi:hypothetical protein